MALRNATLVNVEEIPLLKMSKTLKNEPTDGEAKTSFLKQYAASRFWRKQSATGPSPGTILRSNTCDINNYHVSAVLDKMV